MSNKYENIASVLKVKDKVFGVWEDGKKVSLDGKEVDNQYINLDKPESHFSWLLKNNHITEAEYNQKLSKINEDVLYLVSVTVDKKRKEIGRLKEGEYGKYIHLYSETNLQVNGSKVDGFMNLFAPSKKYDVSIKVNNS